MFSVFEYLSPLSSLSVTIITITKERFHSESAKKKINQCKMYAFVRIAYHNYKNQFLFFQQDVFRLKQPRQVGDLFSYLVTSPRVNRSRRTRAADDDDDDAAFGSALWLYQQEQRGERDAPPRAPRSAEPADDAFGAWESAASAPSGPPSRSGRPPSSVLHPGPAGGEFPVHEGHSVKEFPSHLGIRPKYQIHEENLTKYTVMEGECGRRESQEEKALFLFSLSFSS